MLSRQVPEHLRQGRRFKKITHWDSVVSNFLKTVQCGLQSNLRIILEIFRLR